MADEMTVAAKTRSPPYRHRLTLCLAAGLLAASTLLGVLRAEPLPKEACDLLVEEQQRLLGAGVKEWMAGGAANARSRLSRSGPHTTSHSPI